MKTYTKPISKFIFFNFLSLALVIGSCSKNNPDVIVTGFSKAKVVNAVQAVSNQDVFIDDEKKTLTPLAFGGSSDYIMISSGNRKVSYLGSNDVSTAQSFNFVPSLTYSTFLVSDRNGKQEIVNYEDNLSNLDLAVSKIKLLNLTPYFSTGINVSVQSGTQFVNALMYKESSNYFSLNAGSSLKYNVVGSSIVKTIDAADFEPGKVYSIWFSGLTTATLEAHVILNN